MNTQFKESFTKDLRKIRDKDLLNRAKAVIETVEQAQSLSRWKIQGSSGKAMA